jgi:hypothetical protein
VSAPQMTAVSTCCLPRWEQNPEIRTNADAATAAGQTRSYIQCRGHQQNFSILKTVVPLHPPPSPTPGKSNASSLPCSIEALRLCPGDPTGRTEPEIVTENPNCCCGESPSTVSLTHWHLELRREKRAATFEPCQLPPNSNCHPQASLAPPPPPLKFSLSLLRSHALVANRGVKAQQAGERVISARRCCAGMQRRRLCCTEWHI